MNLEDLRNALPEFARDLKLNLSSLATEAALTEWLTGNAAVSGALALIEPMANTFAYYVHERALQRLRGTGIAAQHG